MLNFTCQPQPEKGEKVDATVLPFWEGPVEAAPLTPWKNVFGTPIRSGDFKGKFGETAFVYDDGARILLLGLGKEELASGETLRRAYASAVRAARDKKVKSIQIITPSVKKAERQEAMRGISEGIFLTNYAFTALKGDSLKENPVSLLEKAIFVGWEKRDEDALRKWKRIAESVHWVRDLVNGNADDVTALTMADKALAMKNLTPQLTLTILDQKQIEQEKMGLLLAVNRGSALEPRLIVLSYNGNAKSKDHIVLVGKGITYDTGGLAIKTPDGMSTMKSDMAGAATVLAVVELAAHFNLPVNVSAVAPMAENDVDGKSFKIGDVYRSMSGKTVEVNNTDAEGRLVIADAITYALKHLKPTAIVDIGTLTGGMVIALGEEISGLFTQNEPLAVDLKKASDATGEFMWRMPLYADYKELLKSDFADIMNSAGRAASSMTCALFIQSFAGDKVPWAHIDFAGPAYQTKPKYYNTARATGSHVRLLIDFLEHRAS